ncbi:MAG: hypothetical protein H6Q55_1553 [Deltaproteobacteria bacterium]|nr:hypothetical protein [Deltaproteobacteria bacterium]
MMRVVWVLLLVFCLVAAYHSWLHREMSRPAGILAAEEPLQGSAASLSDIQKDEFRIKPLATFDIKARVILAKRYWFGQGSGLAPVDLALGWGPMSDSNILQHFKFSQSDRFYFWSTKSFPVSRGVIESHTANMHMIPANDEIEDVLKAVRPGNIVHVKGYLVEAFAPNGWRWRSSLSRTDTGRGACEIIWVESIEVN